MKLVGESFDTAPWTNESDLPLDVAFAYALNLSFSEDVHCLVPTDCPQPRVETRKPETGIDSTFDEPVALLDEVVEIFTLSQLRDTGPRAGYAAARSAVGRRRRSAFTIAGGL